MSRFLVQVQACDVQRNGLDWLPSAVIEQGLANAGCVKASRARAADILRQARAKRVQLREQGRQEYSHAIIKANHAVAQWKKETEDKTVADMLPHLVEQDELEQTLLQALQGRIRQQMATVLREWAGEVDTTDFLVRRLSHLVEEQVGEQNVVLHVAPDRVEAVAAELGSKLTVRADSSMQEDQAELRSSLLTLRIDMQRHFEQLVSRWLGVEPFDASREVCYGQN